MRVPPLPAIEEVNFTHAEAEVAVGVHEGVNDSNHASSWVVQTLSAQKAAVTQVRDFVRLVRGRIPYYLLLEEIRSVQRCGLYCVSNRFPRVS